jgi:hypothetical protein
MNDRELLEMAAKAAGYYLEIPDDIDGIFIMRENYRNGREWNPLTDDGDALRLANRLHLCVCHTLSGVVGAHGTVMVGVDAWENKAPLALEKYSGADDQDEATRRAITRAAAEIGRAM